MSFLQILHHHKLEASLAKPDPWVEALEGVRGKIGGDGVERISTHALLDILEVPQEKRRSGTFRRLARCMRGLGWSPMMARGLTRGGYKGHVRGYCRAE